MLTPERECFAPGPLQLRFVSPIADGADQIAAEVALELGWELQAVLPFDRARISREPRPTTARASGSMPARAGRLRARASRRHSQRELDAYVMTGRATVAHCDLLIAVWDGLPPRGRGGTGEVVAARDHPRHGGHPPAARPGSAGARCCGARSTRRSLTVADDPASSGRSTATDVDALLAGLLMPPPDEQEQRLPRSASSRERLRRIRTRIEYPLLLAAAGVRRLRREGLRRQACRAQIRDEWQRYREGCADAHHISAPIDMLEEAYSWADRLATHFAQTYRSGHIFNFVLGGLAVCLGLGAFMAPHLKFEVAALEMVITFAIILNAHIGRATNGTAAGSTIASSPSGCGRCAA